MDTRRRAFLSYATGLGAAIGVGGVSAAADQKRPTPYTHSEKTRELLSLFGLRYPILQAPAGGATGPEMAAAVCNAGAMGSIALTTASIETAMKNGGITKVYYVDWEVENILGIIGKYKVIVYGE